MKYLAILLLFASCTQGISQRPSSELKSDQEFEALINKFNKTAALNKAAQKVAEHHTEKIVTKTAENIVQLKTDVVALKTELVQTKEVLDSGNYGELSYFKIALQSVLVERQALKLSLDSIAKSNKHLQDTLAYYKSKK